MLVRPSSHVLWLQIATKEGDEGIQSEATMSCHSCSTNIAANLIQKTVAAATGDTITLSEYYPYCQWHAAQQLHCIQLNS